MAQMFHIDLSSLSTHKERYEVRNLLNSHGFDINEHWLSIDETHKTIDYLQAFWSYTSLPNSLNFQRELRSSLYDPCNNMWKVCFIINNNAGFPYLFWFT